MIYIDTSAYIAILNPHDSTHTRAVKFLQNISTQKHITSHSVLGEVLTVGSMRYNRPAAIDFVEDILGSQTQIVYEDKKLLNNAFKIFKNIKQKDVSWIDCYSFAIIEEYKIERVFSFDRDFKKYSKVKILE